MGGQGLLPRVVSLTDLEGSACQAGPGAGGGGAGERGCWITSASLGLQNTRPAARGFGEGAADIPPVAEHATQGAGPRLAP